MYRRDVIGTKIVGGSGIGAGWENVASNTFVLNSYMKVMMLQLQCISVHTICVFRGGRRSSHLFRFYFELMNKLLGIHIFTCDIDILYHKTSHRYRLLEILVQDFFRLGIEGNFPRPHLGVLKKLKKKSAHGRREQTYTDIWQARQG